MRASVTFYEFLLNRVEQKDFFSEREVNIPMISKKERGSAFCIFLHRFFAGVPQKMKAEPRQKKAKTYPFV